MQKYTNEAYHLLATASVDGADMKTLVRMYYDDQLEYYRSCSDEEIEVEAMDFEIDLSPYINPPTQEYKWDLSFKKEVDLIEPCPGCACEIIVQGDGKTTCPECGWEEVLPCTACTDVNTKCDWSRENSCTPYRPIGKNFIGAKT